MQAKQLIAVSALAFLGTTAFAQEATSDAWQHVVSTQSRAEVRAEALRTDRDVRAAGEATRFGAQPASVKSRDAVRAEARAQVGRAVDSFNVGA